MKNLPKPLIVLFVVILVLFLVGVGAGFSQSDTANFEIVERMHGALGDTFLAGTGIDLREIRVARSLPTQPNPIQCFNRAERRFVIVHGTTCRYEVEGSNASSRVLRLRLEEGRFVRIHFRQKEALPTTLTVLSAEAEAETDAEEPCTEQDSPRLMIFKRAGNLAMTCHDGGSEGRCVLVVPE